MINLKEDIKQFWNWLWNSDSWLSYMVFLVLIFIFIKFIFLPGLGIIFGTSLPLAIVESSSMEHYSLAETSPTSYVICGKTFPEKQYFNLDEYWTTCGSWYEQNANITKQKFSEFNLKKGFRKGDIMIIVKKKTTHIGDVIVFEGGWNHPIIHRVISLSPLQTKGDHNEAQLTSSNNAYRADETNIPESKILGTAVIKIPWLGWPKILMVELWNKIAG